MHYRMGCSIEQYRSAIGCFRSRGRKRWRKVLDLRGVRRSRGLWWGALLVLVVLALHLQLHGADEARWIAHSSYTCIMAMLGSYLDLTALYVKIALS
jgi:hypothetical protein